MDDDSSLQVLESTRFWIQKVFVPILVCLGVGGNTITVMVLTRKRMRCSTNIYLTALAVADIIYLLFVFSLSFATYKHIKDRKYELYWRFFGLTHWLCDAASSTSVWLTVSFTVERYIAVCHPIKGKVLCTENRAKSIVVIVAILCLLTTASTTFEYELAFKEECLRNCTFEELRKMQQSSVQGYNETQEEILEEQNSTMDFNATESCCLKKLTIEAGPTNLGNNDTYQTIIAWYSAIVFGLLPVLLIAIFNGFLVHAVYKSQRTRRRMTNTQENISMSNENRITIMLIGVIFLFLLCQTPTASYLITTRFLTGEQLMENQNLLATLGNIFNLLVSTNAACNFLLYCVLSKKYRATFKSLFCERKKRRQDTLAMSSTSRNRNERFSAFKNGLRRNVSEYRTPRNLETQSLTSIPRSKSLMVRLPGKAKSTDLIV